MQIKLVVVVVVVVLCRQEIRNRAILIKTLLNSLVQSVLGKYWSRSFFGSLWTQTAKTITGTTGEKPQPSNSLPQPSPPVTRRTNQNTEKKIFFMASGTKGEFTRHRVYCLSIFTEGFCKIWVNCHVIPHV